MLFLLLFLSLDASASGRPPSPRIVNEVRYNHHPNRGYAGGGQFMGVGGSGYGSWNYPPGSIASYDQPVVATSARSIDLARIIMPGLVIIQQQNRVAPAPAPQPIAEPVSVNEPVVVEPTPVVVDQPVIEVIQEPQIQPVNEAPPIDLPYEFRSEPGEFRTSLETQYRTLYVLQVDEVPRDMSRQFGLLSTEFADASYAQGDTENAFLFRDFGRGFLDIAVGLDPVSGFGRDSYEFLTGQNLITGEELNAVERGMAFLGVATAGGSRYINRAGMAFQRIYENAAHILRGRNTQTAILHGEELVRRGWHRNHRITHFESAAEANARMERIGYVAPPYMHGSHVVHFRTTHASDFVRVHDANNQARTWLVRSGEIRGLTPEQIMHRLNLPHPPTHVSQVRVPGNTPMSRGMTNFNNWDNIARPRVDGQVQYRIEMERVPQEWFSDMREIGRRLE